MGGVSKYLLPVLLCSGLAAPALAQDSFVLSSPALIDKAALPADLKCARDDGDGASPPLIWSGLPDGTKSLALIMHHYPQGTSEGVNTPSQYWLVWNIPAATRALPRGNPASIGDEGSDKDGKRTGYTPPCSPHPWWSLSQEPLKTYIITLYALNGPLALPDHDDGGVDWTVMTQALQGKVIASSALSFLN